MKEASRVSFSVYAGLFLTCCSLLVFELLLTRLFSVTLWYHFAFFAISIALFGLGAAGIFVQLFPGLFSEETFFRQLFLSSLALVVTMLLPTFLLLRVNLPTHLLLNLSGSVLTGFMVLFLLTSLPFFFGGLIVSLLFKRFPDAISRLYFADLLGAGTGCLLTFIMLETLGAPVSFLINAGLGSMGGLFFLAAGRKEMRCPSFAATGFLVPLLLLAAVGYHHFTSAFDLKFAKGFDRSGDEFSKWNSISRVAVFDCAVKAPAEKIARLIWGISPNFRDPFPELKCIDIDAQAGTFLTRFQGDLKSVSYVAYDPPSLVHRLKERPETLIIGAGGGKDVLAALLFGTQHVTAVEVNPIIVNDIMLKRYKEYSGSLYQHPRVTAVAAEGRSYLANQKKIYDIIQLAFVDTSASTSGGAYILAENNLYTVEAFTEYLSHLKEEGIFSVSWVDVPGLYGGTRLVSLGTAALEKLGVGDIPHHLIVVTHAPRRDWIIQTILLKRSPFTEEEEKRVSRACRELGFHVTYSPRHRGESFISKLVQHHDRKGLYKTLPVDISPTTDDRPFFFYQDRLAHLFPLLSKKELPDLTYGAGLQLLSRLLMLTFVLVCLFFVIPMFFSFRREQTRTLGTLRASLPALLYFSCLGLGFMFLEIALLQKFVLFLGHPFYTLTVTLSSVLLFAGLGSLITQRFPSHLSLVYIQRAILLLAILVCVYLWGLSHLFRFFMHYPVMIKAAIAMLLLAPAALLMGMPFPLGIKAVHQHQSKEMIPWAWGINGGTSVLGSVTAMIVAMNLGYGAALVGGVGIYLAALIFAHTSFRQKVSTSL